MLICAEGHWIFPCISYTDQKVLGRSLEGYGSTFFHAYTEPSRSSESNGQTSAMNDNMTERMAAKGEMTTTKQKIVVGILHIKMLSG